MNERISFFKEKSNFILWYDEKKKIILQALKEGGTFWKKTWKQVLYRLKTNVSLIIMSQALEQRDFLFKNKIRKINHIFDRNL